VSSLDSTYQAGWFSTGFHKKLKIGKWVSNNLIDNQVIFQYLAYTSINHIPVLGGSLIFVIASGSGFFWQC
jgi:hypothetical protein